jgi:hypothetical protein
MSRRKTRQQIMQERALRRHIREMQLQVEADVSDYILDEQFAAIAKAGMSLADDAAKAAMPAIRKAIPSIGRGMAKAGTALSGKAAQASQAISKLPGGMRAAFAEKIPQIAADGSTKFVETGKIDSGTVMLFTGTIIPAVTGLLAKTTDALGGIFGEKEQGMLAQEIMKNPRIADAAALYTAMKGFGTDEKSIRTILAKNSGDLPGLAKDYTTAIAIVTGGKKSGDLVSSLQKDGMDEEAEQVLTAIGGSGGASAAPQAMPQGGALGQSMPPGGVTGMMGQAVPQAGAMGQPMPMAEAHLRRAIRKELLKII